MPWSRVRQSSDGTWRRWLLPGPDRSGRRGILRCRGWSRLRPASRSGAVSSFLRDFLAYGNSAASCRSYGHDLLRWFRFLSAVGVAWVRARRADVRDFVLWLRVARSPARDQRRPGAPVSGEVNPRTGKAYLQAGHAPARSTTRCRCWRSSTATTRGPGVGSTSGSAATRSGYRDSSGHREQPGLRLPSRADPGLRVTACTSAPAAASPATTSRPTVPVAPASSPRPCAAIEGPSVSRSADPERSCTRP
jgi:hypothetical protein